MSRLEFALLFCGTWLMFPAVEVWLGLEMSVDRVVTGLVLVPLCAVFMPDRKDQ